MKQILTIISCLLLFACKQGANARKETVLLSNSSHNASCVSFTPDETGRPVVSWCETDKSGRKFFFLSYLGKSGNAFSDAISIPIEQNSNFHEEGMPKLAIKKDGSIVAIYETSAPTKENKFAGFVKYVQSFDQGKTWTKPAFLHADTTAGKGHSFASIARLSDGEIGACWLDVSFGERKGGRSVKFSKTSGKNGFAGETLIDSFACQCCRTAISCDARGNIAVMFRDVLQDSIRDMSICMSADNGRTFSSPVAFTNDGWVINGCPHNGPSVIRSGNRAYAAWFTGGMHKGVYYAEMNESDEVIERRTISSNGRNIQLCLLPDKNRVLAYSETVKTADTFYSKVVVDKINDHKMWTMDISKPGEQAAYPVIHPAGSSEFVVAWENSGKIYYRIIDAGAIQLPVKLPEQMPVKELVRSEVIKLSANSDLVCGMPVKAGVEDTAHYKGKVYGFCAKECKEEFLKDPKQYLTAK